MPRREEALAAMRDALQLQDPEWDITPGTAEYKILEALAQQIENITYNSVLNDYHFDVDHKSGIELDLFMSLFGFARVKAKRSVGSVTFSRGTVAAQDYIIPLGTQVFIPATDFSPSMYFQTTISAVLPTGSTEVTVPAQAVVGGTTGNVTSASITGLSSSVGGITAVNNAQAFSGGRDSEGDADLKDRWRRTAFRNISGTEDQFLAVAFNESAYVTRANLVGPIERYFEQVQLSAPYDLTTTSPWATALDAGDPLTDIETDLTVDDGSVFQLAATNDPDTHFYIGVTWTSTGGILVPAEIMKVTDHLVGTIDLLTVERAATADADNITHAGGAAIRQVFPSSVPDSKYTFAPGGEVVGLNTGLTSQQLGRSGETGDYVLVTLDGTSDGAPIPAGTSLPFVYVTTDGATTFGLDAIIEVEHEYTPISSRNNFSDAGCKTADKVDIFVDGEDPVTVTEQFPFPTHADVLFGTAFTSSEFLRDDGVDPPKDGDMFTQLSKAPITTVPSSISVAATNSLAATIYYKDEDYWLVGDFDDPNGLEGSPRARNGIEWNTAYSAAAVNPTGGSSIPDGVDFTTSPGHDFAANVGAAGGLTGVYKYVYTYEIDGLETYATTDIKTVTTTADKVDLGIPHTNPALGDVIWRKVYRTLAGGSVYYLLKVIKHNNYFAFVDNKPDDALLPLTPPKAPPEAGTLISVEYNYNRLIERLDAQMDQVRLVGMDVLAHAADEVGLRFNLAVVLFPGMSTTDAEADLNTILSAWIRRKSFRNNIQVADVIEEVGQSADIDNVRLARAGEEKNEAQKVTVTTTRATPDATVDKFTLKVGTYTTGAIAYNETASVVRELLEALPNIHEGNTYATTLNAAVATTIIQTIAVDDNPGLHIDSDGTLGPIEGFYVHLTDTADATKQEIIYVTSVIDNGGDLTWTVKRAQLGTTAATYPTLTTDIHILGDVGVTYSASGTDHIYTVYFLPNAYTDVNDWGTRKLNLIVAAKSADASKLTFVVARKVQGTGSGIQVVAANGLTISATYYDDFYLDSDELPSLVGVNLIAKAQNTF